ncbi:MAG TPA: terminase TerL endonuclease subunit [Stellaceae bacterium]|nr:terminase TerL endonuclease subunit [Stellaceae bacterium]
MTGWTTALPDWEERIVERRSLLPCDPLFPDEAQACLDIFCGLRLVDVPGKPTIGEVCRPWVIDFARVVFGSYDPETGRRLIRRFLLLISKKNSKSTIAAGLALTLLLRNWRQSNELLILAPTIEIAGNSFKPARDMIRADEQLNSILHVQDHLRTITHRATEATLKIVAADAETVGGKKAAIVIVDELWLFGKRAGAESMLLEAEGGLASRPEGCTIYLSTHSDEPPAGVWDKTLSEFRKIRAGEIDDPRALGLLYEFPPSMLKDESFRDQANWYITNPNLGASVDREFLVDKFNEAERAGEASLRVFAAKHLNVEIGMALRADGWAGAEYWEQGVEPGLTLQGILARSEVVTVGIDGGGLDDLLGLYMIGREIDTHRWLGWGRAFLTPEAAARRKANATVYAEFIGDGDLVMVDALPEDLSRLVEIVKQVRDSGLLDKVGVDAMGIGGIVDALAEIDVSEETGLLIAVRQGIALMGAIKTVERKLADKSFVHCGGRMMAWCVGNIVIVPTPTAMRVARDESGRGKIDPAAAMFDAAALMATNPPARRSVYEDRGLLVI